MKFSSSPRGSVIKTRAIRVYHKYASAFNAKKQCMEYTLFLEGESSDFDAGTLFTLISTGVRVDLSVGDHYVGAHYVEIMTPKGLGVWNALNNFTSNTQRGYAIIASLVDTLSREEENMT